MDIQKKYEDLANDVRNTLEPIINSMPIGSAEETLYKGLTILFSPLLYRPSFLLIGINPGAGNFEATQEKHRNYHAFDKLEYLTENYTLARETKAVFSMTKYADELENSMKTNVYYLATKNVQDLNALGEIIKTQYKLTFFEKSLEWTKRLIEIVEPKAIICEGMAQNGDDATYALADIFNQKISLNGDIGTFSIGSTPVIGYRRLNSSIRDKSNLAAEINKLKIN